MLFQSLLLSIHILCTAAVDLLLGTVETTLKMNPFLETDCQVDKVGTISTISRGGS